MFHDERGKTLWRKKALRSAAAAEQRRPDAGQPAAEHAGVETAQNISKIDAC